MSAAVDLADDAARDELREVAQRFLATAASSERVRSVVDAGGLPDRRLVSGAAGMGWFGLEIPERLGGSGAGFTELVVLLEELGARAASLPLLSSAVLCAGAVRLGGSAEQQDRWLPALAEGSRFGTLLLPRTAGPEPDTISARRDGGGVRLHGHCRYVPDARASDILVVVAGREPGEPVVAVVERDHPGVAVEPVAMTDGTRCLDHVRLDHVLVDGADVLARGDRARQLGDALRNRASVAVAADAVGVARQVLDMTVTYARQRTQFGRAIGSFQAVKHQAADVLVDLETSRVLVGDATRAVELDPAGSPVAASMAKAHACEKGARAAGVAVQLHGGIGYTWEHDLHLYLKRAKLDEQLFGDARWHRRRVAAHLLDRPSGIEEVR